MLNIETYINTPIEIEENILDFFNRTDDLIIFDIGACEGEDSIRYSRLFPHSRVYSFEPLPKNIDLIKKNVIDYGAANIMVNEIALSDTTGKAIFFVSSGHPEGVVISEAWDYGNKSSSLLAPDKVKQTHPWIEFKEKIEVSTDTLKNFCIDKGIENIDFVHLDVQGAELKVLEGAEEFIDSIKVIWLEVESVTLYKDQPLRENIEVFLGSRGFVNVLSKVSNISGDQLYVNKRFFPKCHPVKTSLKIKAKEKIKSIFIKKYSPKSVVTAAEHHCKKSYSQSGEDVIIDFIFKNIGIEKPSYIDIGAHHPYFISNTALFYEKGCSGVNIEPDPSLFTEFVRHRRRDINLNVGLGEREDVLDFYIMSVPTLNTFSKEEANKYIAEGFSISRIEKVKVLILLDIIKKYCNDIFPDFLSLDVEGLDEVILKAINFEKSPPVVVCVETISFSSSGRGIKNDALISFLISNGYLLYADTNINSIFVRRDRWER